MTLRILTAAVATFLLPTFVFAQSNLTGKWIGLTPNGTELVFDLSATDTTMTGTITRGGLTAPIADGKVSKATFTFKATFNDQTESVSGEFSGDDMKAWLDRQGPDFAAKLKRTAKDAERGFAGVWQGTTASGRSLTLNLEVDGQRLTGRLTLAQQSTDITTGKVDGKTFAFTAGPLDGRAIVASGRLAGEALELKVEGVADLLTLTRVK